MLELLLEKKLYPKTAVKAAKAAFDHLAVITLGEKRGYHVVSFDKVDPDVLDMIKEEFANYALYATVQKAK